MNEIEESIRAYIPEIIHMSFATSRDDLPWVTEVHFAYDDNLNLYFRSKNSRRHSQEIALNQNVAGNIVRQFKKNEEPSGVYFEARAELLESEEGIQKAYECLGGRFGYDERLLEEAKKVDGHKFYKVSVDVFYYFGHIGDVFGKHELVWNKR